jgi:LPS O-antigen subunit length determinant protein (WzzB/FepE family)
MLTSYEFFKALSALTTDEEILAFVKKNKEVRDFYTGDKTSDTEYLVLTFDLTYTDEEDIQEVVDKYFEDGYTLTEEELNKVCREASSIMTDNTENLPPTIDFFEFALEEMFKDHPKRK